MPGARRWGNRGCVRLHRHELSERRQSDARGDTQALLNALSSPVRRDILWLVWERELAAGEIAAQFALTAPTISQHLSVLRDAGLVEMSRQGTFRRYRARQDAVAPFQQLLTEGSAKWAPSEAPPPAVPTRRLEVVEVAVQVAVDVQSAFRAFTDGEVYGRWAGVPVTIEDGRFSATMEWGLEVRGTYDYVLPPVLIVMTWDFDLDQVPLPGAGQRAYLEVRPSPPGCEVSVRQLVDDASHAEKMERAWGLMLARFQANVVDAVDPAKPMPPRQRVARRR